MPGGAAGSRGMTRNVALTPWPPPHPSSLTGGGLGRFRSRAARRRLWTLSRDSEKTAALPIFVRWALAVACTKRANKRISERAHALVESERRLNRSCPSTSACAAPRSLSRARSPTRSPLLRSPSSRLLDLTVAARNPSTRSTLPPSSPREFPLSPSFSRLSLYLMPPSSVLGRHRDYRYCVESRVRATQTSIPSSCDSVISFQSTQAKARPATRARVSVMYVHMLLNCCSLLAVSFTRLFSPPHSSWFRDAGPPDLRDTATDPVRHGSRCESSFSSGSLFLCPLS
jgi:hypothetical protein